MMGLVEHPRSSFLIYSLDFIAERFVYVLKPLISTAGGRFHFITVQGRHLFKETTFTVSTLPRAWLEPPHSLCSLRGLKAHAIPANVFGGSSNRGPRSRRLPFQSTRQHFELANDHIYYDWVNQLKHL